MTMYTIYGKENCSSCDSAKLLLEEKNEGYSYKVLGRDFSLTELFDIAPKNIRSFPVIFKGDEYIGGFKDLKELLVSETSSNSK